MRFFSPTKALAALTLSLSAIRSHVGALQLDPASPGTRFTRISRYQSLTCAIDSIKDVSSKVAKQLVAQYAAIDDKGNTRVLGGYPGVLYPPYYWWQAGAMLGTLLDYWHYTGDAQYNNLVRDGLIHQFGERLDLVCLDHPALLPRHCRFDSIHVC